VTKTRTKLKPGLDHTALSLACLSEECRTFQPDVIVVVRNMRQASHMAAPAKSLDLPERILQRVVSDETIALPLTRFLLRVG
jgi:hypothetical protein